MKIDRSSLSVQHQEGFLLIEVLVSLLIVAFGLLAIASFITKATAMGADTAQSARALALATDMAERISANKKSASSYYVLNGSNPEEYGGLTSAQMIATCPLDPSPTGEQLATWDLCVWGQALAGADDGGGAVALSYRGCITHPNALDTSAYVVSVAYGTVGEAVPPVDTCGSSVFGAKNRRVVRLLVRIANLAA